jgi:AraC family ethanolamine operon transcriptional activator
MSNIIFSAGLILNLPGLDLEMMQYYAKQWNLEHTKMEKGLFEGSTFAAHTPRIQLAKVYYSQGFMSKGDFPEGCIVLIYSSNNTTYNFQNRSILANEIIVLTEGDEINILTSGEIDIHTLVIEEQLFYQAFYDYFGDIPRTSLQDKRFCLKADMISVFHQTVHSWTSYLTEEFPTLSVKPEYEKIEFEILRQLFSCMHFTPLEKSRKKFQTKRIRDLLHENIDQEIDISLLTNELNIGESQLHHAFKKEYGITPKKYLQQLRFNAIKKELLLAHPHTNTVSQIAQKYNFFHMGHFSAEYKKLFAETPSQTLNSH